MVHVSFIRKQLMMFIKVILLASFLVYLLSVLVNLIPSDPTTARRSRGEMNNKHNKKNNHIRTHPGNKNGDKRKPPLDTQDSIMDRWTTFARKIFGSIQGDMKNRGSANVHRWYTVCGNTIDNLRRHILFPKHPKLRTSITDLKMRTKLRDFGERVFGYMHPPLDGVYQFTVSSDDFSEVWLSTDSSPNRTQLICQVGGMIKGRFIMGYTRLGEFGKYESQTSANIYLEAGEKYFFEVLHKQGQGEGHLHVAWKMPGVNYFTIITGEFLSLFMKEDYTQPMLTRDDHAGLPEVILSHHRHARAQYRQSVRYRNYTRHANTTGIELLRQTSKTLQACRQPVRAIHTPLKRYQGRHYTQTPSIFPEDGSNYVIEVCQWAKAPSECTGNPLLPKEKAHDVVNKYLKSSRSGNYSLKSIIIVEECSLALDGSTGDRRYFMEMVVQDLNGSTRLIADHVVLNKTKQFCNPVPNFWTPDVTIYVIITAKNQGIWVRHFVDNMVDIERKTGDKNLHLIIVDFGSKDIDIDNYMKNNHVKHFTVIHKTGRFFKTLAINEAAASVKDDNSIVLQLDLHLDVPINLMQIIRKHTIQGQMAFVPLLTRLSCGSSPEYPTGHWEDQGYGLFAIYKSDWDRFGGMNTQEFSNHWGGEDWEMIDRVISHGIGVQKLKIPGLFHFFHNRRGMWDKAV